MQNEYRVNRFDGDRITNPKYTNIFFWWNNLVRVSFRFFFFFFGSIDFSVGGF
jgi:hypothetical protein